jgi:hypothetical protein
MFYFSLFFKEYTSRIHSSMHLFCLDNSVIHWGGRITQVSRILSTSLGNGTEEISSPLFLPYPIPAHKHSITMCA